MSDTMEIWSFIPAPDFEVPAPPATDAARGRVLRMWRWLRRLFHDSAASNPPDETQWDRPSAEKLRSLSPDPDWSAAAHNLAASLGCDWFQQPHPDRSVSVFVGAPGCGIAETMQLLAQQRKLTILAAPLPESLLESQSSNISALQAFDDATTDFLVIPNLEGWFLRHESGLNVIQELVGRLTKSPKQVLIGCDSWAWAFLNHVIGIQDILGEPKTLAPFDAIRLDAWFRTEFDRENYEFRQSDDDEPIFPKCSEKHASKPSPRELSALIRSLAARARGNPSVALELWRSSLRTSNSNNKNGTSTSAEFSTALWVVAPSEFSPLQLPSEKDRLYRFILHAVLIHGGLALSWLLELLPFASDEIRCRVSVLCRAGILEELDGKLRVCFTAYPQVRKDLADEGFLTDAF